MSNFLAIGTVTAALRRLVLEAVQTDVSGALVSTLRPAEPGSASGIPGLGVNVYLYQAVPIAPLRNTALPSRRSSGAMVERPIAALELHYLFSFYGNDALHEPQRLMGSTLAKLMAEPILRRSRIEAVLADAQTPFLADSDLPEQIDSVKLSPLALSLEEMSRVWSVFFQTRYTLSMAWRASAILIEPQIQARPALPVRQPAGLAVATIRKPRIDRVVSSAGDEAPILPGSGILVRGQRLRSDALDVSVGGVAVAPTRVADDELALTLPAGLEAGPQSVLIRHGVLLGNPPVVHTGMSSNPGGFVLHPVIAQAAGDYVINVSNVTGSSAVPRSADVSVTTTVSIGRRQQALLELLVSGTVNPPVFRTFVAADRATDGTVLAFALTGMSPGTYLVRLRVDGAESPLELDATVGSPTFQQPIRPALTIP